ncbi:hypothetical protein DFH29DRAFT_930281 [Suillus ampliporus]|nr:hypothetical protein DFH29DRAFT_930281 [Suillus ampliporus]
MAFDQLLPLLHSRSAALSHTPWFLYNSAAGAGNPWNAHALAISPPQRMSVSWHQDLVYNIMWFLLVQLERRNKASDAGGRARIQTVLMTGLGTGTGSVGVDKYAQQIMLVVKHFQMPLADRVRWNDVEQRVSVIRATTDSQTCNSVGNTRTLGPLVLLTLAAPILIFAGASLALN